MKKLWLLCLIAVPFLVAQSQGTLDGRGFAGCQQNACSESGGRFASRGFEASFRSSE